MYCVQRFNYPSFSSYELVSTTYSCCSERSPDTVSGPLQSAVLSRMLAASGWEGCDEQDTVNIYCFNNNGHSEEKRFYYHGKPVLAFTFAAGNRIASRGLDQIVVKIVDIVNPQNDQILAAEKKQASSSEKIIRKLHIHHSFVRV